MSGSPHYKSLITWDEMWLLQAFLASERSKDPSTRVGAVVVSPDNRQSTVGYNGFPSRVKDLKDWWNNRGEDDVLFTKYDLVLHAESNAMDNAQDDLEGWTLYCTHHPCLDCAKRIVGKRIARVVIPKESDDTTMDLKHDKVAALFQHAGVEFTQVDVDHAKSKIAVRRMSERI